MPVSLNTFANAINNVNLDKTDKSIILKHDQVKAGSNLHRASTFRNTTNAFIQAYREQYGDHMGEVASQLLQHDIKAGKPLKASVVKSFIELGKQHQAQQSVSRMISSKATMEGTMRELLNKPELTLTDKQFGQLRHVFRGLQSSLIATAHLKGNGAYDNLMDMLKQNQFPMIGHATKLILGDQSSPLVRSGYPNEQNPQMQEDKLKLLTMMAPMDATDMDIPLLNMGMDALTDMRNAKPAPAELNGADLFQTLFPEGTTPTMTRPSREEVELYTPAQMKDLLTEAKQDFMNNFGPDNLPTDSVFKGKGLTLNTLNIFKSNNIQPGKFLTLCSNRVTLQDMPNVQSHITLNTAFDSLRSTQLQVIKDMHRLGITEETQDSQPPTISFTAKDGQKAVETVGNNKFPPADESLLPEDLGDYITGKKDMTALPENVRNELDHFLYQHDKQSSTVTNIFDQVAQFAQSPEQHKSLMGTLTQNALFPMVDTMRSFGDFGDVNEHSHINIDFQQNQDNSVDVCLTTGDQLKGLSGTATMTYHVDVDGRIGISDFQWDKPTIDEQKEAILQATGNNKSGVAYLQQALNSHQKLNGTQTSKLFMELGTAKLENMLAQATTQAELPNTAELKEMLAFTPPDKTNQTAHTILDRLLKVCETPNSAAYIISHVPQEKRLAFSEATSLLNAYKYYPALDDIREHLDQIIEAGKEKTLSQNDLWEILHHEPLPKNARFDQNGFCTNMDTLYGMAKREPIYALADKIAQENNTDPSNAHQESLLLLGKIIQMNDLGISLKKVEDILKKGTDFEITTQDVNLGPALIVGSRLDNVDDAFRALSRDFNRMMAMFSDERGKLPPTTVQGEISLKLPAEEGKPDEVLTFNPQISQGNSEEERTLYAKGRADQTSWGQGIKDRIVNYCGKDHLEQATTAIMAMSQGGSRFTGVGEVMDIKSNGMGSSNITLSHDDAHNLHVTFENVKDCPMHFHWDYVIAPDGKQTLQDLSIKRADA